MCGIPDVLHVDHGSDFTSRHLEYTAVALKIRLVYSTVGRPQGRGKSERFFRTLNTELLEALPGHIARGAAAPKPVLDLPALDAAIVGFIAPTTSAPTASSGSVQEGMDRRRLAAPHARDPRGAGRAPPDRA